MADSTYYTIELKHPNQEHYSICADPDDGGHRYGTYDAATQAGTKIFNRYTMMFPGEGAPSIRIVQHDETIIPYIQ